MLVFDVANEMPVIAVTHRLYAEPRLLIRRLESAFGCPVYTDPDLLEITSADQGINTDLLDKVVRGNAIPLNHFTHDREKCLSALAKTLSNLVSQGNCILAGIISHLIPDSVTHVLRILASAPETARISRALDKDHSTHCSALTAMEKHDRRALGWVEGLKGANPWDHALYDLVIPPEDDRAGRGREPGIYMSTAQADALARQILARLEQAPFAPPFPREREVLDFRIEADAALALAPVARGLIIRSRKGNVRVTLDRKVMNLVQIQQTLIDTVSALEGVVSVKTRIGPNYYRGKIVRNFDFKQRPGYKKPDTENEH